MNQPYDIPLTHDLEVGYLGDSNHVSAPPPSHYNITYPFRSFSGCFNWQTNGYYLKALGTNAVQKYGRNIIFKGGAR